MNQEVNALNAVKKLISLNTPFTNALDVIWRDRPTVAIQVVEIVSV